jgi:hypothetical protein
MPATALLPRQPVRPSRLLGTARPLRRLRAARPLHRAAVLAWLLVVAGCATHTMPALDPAEVETMLFLIGDAGEPDPRRIGVPLDSLYAQAARAPDRSVIVFLGDNVYPDGIPEEGHAEYADARRRLDAQVRAVPAGARGIFVPGNHDWAGAEPFGLYSIRLQERLIDELAAGRDVRLLPSNGCPGPVAVDIGRLRLLLLDTQWWLHAYIVNDALSDCPTDVGSVTALLREQARPDREGRVVVVAAHHPLMTGGVHGGYCGITGPFRRFAGRSQDIISRRNREMRDSIESALHEHRALVYAAGHDHNLQVMRGGAGADWLLVSGAGAQTRVACAVRMRESEFVAQHRVGFMRLDILRGGGVLLNVFDYASDGSGGLSYSRWIEPRPVP